jgi:hypothetical protein
MSLPFSGHLSGSTRAGEEQSFLYIKASANEHTLDSKEHAMLMEVQHRFKMKILIYSTEKLNTCYSTRTFQRFCFKLEASLLVTPHVSKPHYYVNHMFMRP